MIRLPKCMGVPQIVQFGAPCPGGWTLRTAQSSIDSGLERGRSARPSPLELSVKRVTLERQGNYLTWGQGSSTHGRPKM